ncbi:MAG: type I-U CRISPR-associated RAMP protein Csb1/Cas7u [Myxococcota bacterium]
MAELTYDDLRNAVAGDTVAIRATSRLEPVGGPNDKVFPPTFGDEMQIPQALDGPRELPRTRTKYALEWRRVDGRSRLCVLLDSVASQANRLEEALLEAWNAKRLRFPMVRVDFTGQTHEDPALDLSTLGGDGYLTALEVPHRLADALLRDSLLDGTPFRASEPGRRFTEATPANATSLYALCPSALVFGLWDSTGPKGGLGAKFQRALVSEITGVGVELGVKSASRIDPTGIEKTEIYEAKDPEEGWTADPDAAKKSGGKPVLLKRKGDKAGSPSVINHGNVTPSVDPRAGGVTLDYGEHVSVLSLPALRRLRFPTDVSGKRLDADAQGEAEVAARTALAALGLAALAEQRKRGYDLRSRCAFRPLAPLSFEIVPGDGTDPSTATLSVAGAGQLLAQAAEAAANAGMAWNTDPIDLVPAEKLVALIRHSRALTKEEGEEQ